MTPMTTDEARARLEAAWAALAMPPPPPVERDPDEDCLCGHERSAHIDGDNPLAPECLFCLKSECSFFRSAAIDRAFKDPAYVAGREDRDHAGHRKMALVRVIGACQPCAARRLKNRLKKPQYLASQQANPGLVHQYEMVWGPLR